MRVSARSLNCSCSRLTQQSRKNIPKIWIRLSQSAKDDWPKYELVFPNACFFSKIRKPYPPVRIVFSKSKPPNLYPNSYLHPFALRRRITQPLLYAALCFVYVYFVRDMEQIEPFKRSFQSKSCFVKLLSVICSMSSEESKYAFSSTYLSAYYFMHTTGHVKTPVPQIVLLWASCMISSVFLLHVQQLHEGTAFCALEPTIFKVVS